VILIFLLPETSHTNILLRRAERLRAVTGDQSYKSQTEIARGDKGFGQVLSFALIKPFEVSCHCCLAFPAPTAGRRLTPPRLAAQITIKDPSIAFANAYVALIYSTYYFSSSYLFIRRGAGGFEYRVADLSFVGSYSVLRGVPDPVPPPLGRRGGRLPLLVQVG